MSHLSTLAMLVALTALPPGAVLAQAGKAPAPSDSVVVALDAKDCRRILAQRGMVVQHQPAPDVTYQPGRDVDSRGRPIAPADLPSSTPGYFDGPIELPVVIPLEALPIQRPPGIGRSELPVGRVTIDTMTGKTALNGRPLDPPAEDAVAVACRDYLAKARPRR